MWLKYPRVKRGWKPAPEVPGEESITLNESICQAMPVGWGDEEAKISQGDLPEEEPSSSVCLPVAHGCGSDPQPHHTHSSQRRAVEDFP